VRQLDGHGYPQSGDTTSTVSCDAGSMRASVLAAVAIALAFAVAGCGGSSEHYSLQASLPCLHTVGNVAEPDFSLPNIAHEGALRLDFADGNTAAVAFETSATDAEKDTKSFAKLFDGIGLTGLVDRYETVAVVWETVPTDVQKGALKYCLAA